MELEEDERALAQSGPVSDAPESMPESVPRSEAPSLSVSIRAASVATVSTPPSGKAQRRAATSRPFADPAAAIQRVQRSALRAPLADSSVAPRVQRIQAEPSDAASSIAVTPASSNGVIQRKQPSGWKTDDESTWAPSFYPAIDYTLVADALSTLNLDTQRDRANAWAKSALDNNLIGTGSIRSTYKSSYDRDPDAFSVSQNVPQIPQLVVHGHIDGSDNVADDGGVNLKWAHDEIGHKASGIPQATASTLIDVAAARAHWEVNPEHDAAEEDAADILTGEAIVALFDTTAAEKEAALAKKQEEKDLINWGWKNTLDKQRYGAKLTGAQQAKKAGNDEPMEKLLQIIRAAQARKAAAATP